MSKQKPVTMRRLIVVLSILLVTSVLSFAKDLDSLINSLDNLQGKKRLETLLEITWNLRNNRPDSAIKYCQEAIILADSLRDYEELAKAYSFMGVLYRNLGYYSIAFSYYKQGMKEAEKHGVISQLGYSYNNIGNIYLYQKLPDLAIYYLHKADSVASINNNYDLKAYALQNIGRAFLMKNEPDSTIKYLRQTIRIRKKYKIFKKLPVSYKYLADAYKAKGDYINALKYYRQTAVTADFTVDYDLYSDYLYNMADLYLKLKRLDSALIFAKKSLDIARNHSTQYRELQAYTILSDVYAAKGDFHNAYLASQGALRIKNKLFNDEVLKSIKSIQFTEEAAKKEAEISLLRTNLELEEFKNRRNTLIILLGLLVLLAVMVLLNIIYRKNKQVRKYVQKLKEHNMIIQEKNEELATHARLLTRINDKLTQRDRVIKESIGYARRIASSIMAPEYLFIECSFIKDHFIINRPLEEIGGDFYYFNRFEKFVALVVADATGHGIPGAFLSIISVTIFKDILFNEDEPDAAEVLEEFRRNIKIFLRQGDKEITALYDSVDVALVLFFPQKKIIRFSGARRPLYIVSAGELKEIKGIRATAGYSMREFKFESHTLSFEQVDRLYLFTDGITDILGGEGQERLGSYGWKKLLLEIQDYTMSGQKSTIEQAIERWTEKGRQPDDILIIGIELDK